MKRSFLIAAVIVAATLAIVARGTGQTSLLGSGHDQSPTTRPAPSGSTPLHAVGAPAQVASKANAGAPAAPANGSQFQTAAGLPALPPAERMIVKNGSLSLMVDDPEGSLSRIDQLVQAEQGVIANQTVRTQDDKTFVNLTIQVPPDTFEDTLAKLRDLRAHGTRVVTDTVSSQDVTEQYVDLDAQYRNLQTSRDAYQKLLDKAAAVGDIITLTREVANIQTQMDQIKGRQNLIGRQAAISTIQLSLSPVGTPVQPGPRPSLQPAQAAQQAWSALLTGLQGLAVVLIWLGILIPIPAAVLISAWLVYRRMARPVPYQPEGSRN